MVVAARESLLELFRTFDQNGDGTIAEIELKEVLMKIKPSFWTDKKCDKLFDTIDVNRDGNISFVELMNWLFNMPESGVSEKARIKMGLQERSEGEVLVNLLIEMNDDRWARTRDAQKLEMARSMLSSPNFSDVNYKDPDLGSALHGAAASGILDICESIVKNPHFKEINHANKAGFTALHVAAQMGHAAICRLLMDTRGFSETNAVTSKSTSTLDLAVASDDLEVVRCLVEHPRYTLYTARALGYAKSNLEMARFMHSDDKAKIQRLQAIYDLLLPVCPKK